MQSSKAPLLLLAAMLLSASMAHARTSNLQGATDAMNVRACIALKYSALPDRYYDCVKQALAFNKAAENSGTIVLADSIELSAGNANTATPSVTLRLAQNTTTEVINNGVAQTPRVISRPQLVTDEPSNSDPVTAPSTSTEENAQTDTLPAWLPEPAKAWLGSVLSERQLELLGRNWLYGLLAIGALILLPLLLRLISSTRRRGRYAHTGDYAPADARQTDNLFDDLDFGELDVADKNTKKEESRTRGDDKEVGENKHQASSAAETSTEQTETNAGEGISVASESIGRESVARESVATDEDISDHDDTALLPESSLDVQTAQATQGQEPVDVLETETAETPHTAESIATSSTVNTTGSSETSASTRTNTQNDLQGSPAALSAAGATAPTHESVNLSDDRSDRSYSNSGDNGNGASIHAASDESDDANEVPSGRRPLTRFGSWLHDLPLESGKPASMEAFMYWVSYSDGNIKPGLAEELAEAEELDDHGRIKKAVLSFKPEVLDDILLSLGKHLDSDAKRSFLDLMLAVLVNNSQPTAVQNLLFRFYADYTGMGVTHLNERFEAAFASELPGIPRPDRAQWWDQQSDTLTESTFTNAIDINLQTFGLNRSATAEDIDTAYRLAEKRHDPANFKALGEKEQALAERSFNKYRKSHELLTEIEA